MNFSKLTTQQLIDMVKKDYKVIKLIPKSKCNKNVWKTAIDENVHALYFIPRELLTEEMFLYAVEKSSYAFNFIPGNRITKKICEHAIKHHSSAIKYIPERFRNKDLLKEIFKQDWKSFEDCPDEFKTFDYICEILDNVLKNNNIHNLDMYDQKVVSNILYALKETRNKDVEIWLDKFRCYNIKEKYYNKFNKKFIITKSEYVYDEIETIKLNTFKEFYDYLEGNLKGADLYDYTFEDVDFSKYNLKDINIKSSVLIKKGLYNDDFYKKNIVCLKKNELIVNEQDNNKSISILHESNLLSQNYWNDIKTNRWIYYISDLHIDYKIAKKFPKHATELEVRTYIKYIIKRMLENKSGYNWACDRYLLIAGDVSNSFQVSKMFYEELLKTDEFYPENIICVLGNHELWNVDKKVEDNADHIIDLYKKFFDDLGITLLQNELVTFLPEKRVYTKEQLLKMSKEQIQDITVNSRVTILGGLGFSSYNPEFNVNCRIYNNTIIDQREEERRTNEFFELYKKLKKDIFNKRMIVLTHNPKKDWSNDSYNHNWIYVSGHTHVNSYQKNEFITCYEDNQIGYYNEEVCLKEIDFSIKTNIFQYYEDGIYKITTKEYKDFYYKLGYSISCSIKVGQIYVIKRNDMYMFVYKNEKEKLYLLNGGKQNVLKNQDIEYYYNYLNVYTDIVKQLMNPFYDYLKKVSEYVKSFGGTGIVHGTIVDIDYWNHIYFNVFDGSITPYFAYSITDKVYYKSLKGLLRERAPQLFLNYQKLLQDKSNTNLVVVKDLDDISKKSYTGTEVYKASRDFRKVQYMLDDNIVRVWNDEIIKNGNAECLLLI